MSLKTSIIDSHKDYYLHVDGPIGGNERFTWVVKNFFADLKGKKVLEIGCGEGSLLQMLERGNKVYGIDISGSGVEKTKQKGITCHLADASNEALPYEDNFFDVVITLETIEHVENPHRMLWEMKRVLKEGGILLISIPGEKVDHPYIYPGLFKRVHFLDFLTSNGFSVERILGWGQAPFLRNFSKKIEGNKHPFYEGLGKLIFYIGRKRNLLMRKRFGTPLDLAHCINFLCVNSKSGPSRVEQVASQTTPR